jgi:dephospho-CoA kinase
VFADATARRELEAIVHPAVYRASAAGLRAFELTGAYPFAVVDLPLLFETGAEKIFDKVIVTSCALETQLGRLRARGLSDTAASQRLAAQWPADKKALRADYLVDTDGPFEATDARVDDIAQSLKSAIG